jgi:hypothetical protein
VSGEVGVTAVLNYEGRVFRPDGVDAPTGHYHHDGDLVWAEFGGGYLRTGRLVGTCDPDGTITAAYCQVDAEGNVVAGEVVSRPTVLPDGRVRLAEHWRRADGSTGVSHIEEIT